MRPQASPIHTPLRETELRAALSGLTGTSGAGIVALLPEAEGEKLPILQSCCRALGLPLFGAVFPALLVDGRERRDGVWLLRFCQLPPLRLESGTDTGWLADLPGWVAASGWAEPVLFSVFDATLPHLYTLLRRMGESLDDQVVYAGANAGSETFQPMPCLFDAERVTGDGVLLALLPPSRDLTVEHGYAVPARMMRTTATAGNRILALDGLPAFQAYAAALAGDYGITLTADTFYQHAVHYPFAVLAGDSLVQVRIPVALDDDGAIACVGEVPQDIAVVILRAPSAAESDCVPRLAADLGQDETPLLTFYCAGRRMHLGQEQAEAEMAALLAATRARAMVGALSLGEVSTDGQGRPAFHNAALVCLRLQDS